MNERTKALLKEASSNGYMVVNGTVIYKGKSKKAYNWRGYFHFNLTLKNFGSTKIRIHQLVAFQKYGEAMFDTGIEVRHLDSNSLNNKEDNISIGTKSENQMDISVKKRIERSLYAASHLKKYDHTRVFELHQKGYSYTKIMKELGIKSKGSLSYIINSIKNNAIAITSN